MGKKKEGRVKKLNATKGVKVNTKKAAPATKYEGGFLVLSRKNLRGLLTILGAVNVGTLSDDDRAIHRKTVNKVHKEYRKFQKSLPKAKRDALTPA